MANEEREMELSYAGPGENFDDAYIEQTQPRGRAASTTHREKNKLWPRVLLIAAGSLFLFAVMYFALLLYIRISEVPVPPPIQAAEMPGRQSTAQVLPKRGKQLLIQDGAIVQNVQKAERTATDWSVAEGAAEESVPASREDIQVPSPAERRAVSSYSDEVYRKNLLEALNGISKNTSLIADAVKKDPVEPDSALVSSIEDMSEEMRKIVMENAGLQQKVEELAEEAETLRARLAEAGKTKSSGASSATQPAPKAQPAAKGKTAVKAGADPGVPGWRILGLSANRAVIRDRNGKIHNLGVGDTLENVTIKAVDLKSGHITTSAGRIAYGTAK